MEPTTPSGETEETRREYGELLEEIRVALPGVEVLFAFLLTVPFSNRFDQMRGDLKSAYFAALLFVAFACALLLAPTAHHRMRFHHGDKAWIIRLGSRFALGAMLALAAGVSVTLYVVTSLILSHGAAVAVGAGSAATLLALWYVIPMMRRRPRG
ncbi:MAG: DUF6328 family protein [Polyangiales bacterium]